MILDWIGGRSTICLKADARRCRRKGKMTDRTEGLFAQPCAEARRMKLMATIELAAAFATEVLLGDVISGVDGAAVRIGVDWLEADRTALNGGRSFRELLDAKVPIPAAQYEFQTLDRAARRSPSVGAIGKLPT